MSQVYDSRFSRDARLVNGYQYSRVFEKNSRSADRYFTILSRSSSDHQFRDQKSGANNNEGSVEVSTSNQPIPARLGMAVAKKCAKRAVDRNRLKRLARESFRQHKHSLAGFDIVLLARHASVTASNKTLLESLEMHWSRVIKNA